MQKKSRSVALGLGLALLATPAFAGPTRAARPHEITIFVLPGRSGLPGPDGRRHDSFVPSSFVLKKGVKTELRIINYDDGPHTMYAPGLNLDVLVMPGKHVPIEASDGPAAGNGIRPTVTTATLTPAHVGIFRWHCTMPCDGENGHWAMSMGPSGPGRNGYMAGYFVVR